MSEGVTTQEVPTLWQEPGEVILKHTEIIL